jgi:hypothetical protein
VYVSNKSSASEAPSFFWGLFFLSSIYHKDKDLIIRRLLSSGSWDAVCWMRRQIGDQELREWLIAHKGKGLTPCQLRFWGLVYDLPARQVNSWVRAAQNGYGETDEIFYHSILSSVCSSLSMTKH